jgi:predicted NAD/FAD-dependent oxidoreductase
MNPAKPGRIAIVGAGLSGLSCASMLSALGFDVRMFDKGRGPGGRTSTRRALVGDVEVGFDHGAQYFTVRDPDFLQRVQEWDRLGVVKRWRGRIAVLDPDGSVRSYSDKPRFVGTPAMSSLCKHLAIGQDLSFGVRVARIESSAGLVTLFDEHGDPLGEFDSAVCTAPPAQTVDLIAEAAPELAFRAASVTMKPCWAVMAAFESSLDAPYDGAFINEGPLSWIARTSSKPYRIAQPDRWVLHGSASWSEQHLDGPAERVAEELLATLFRSTRLPARAPVHVVAHRWRYAIAENPLEEGCLYDERSRIGACGDWADGNRVEGAILSGVAMARRIAEPA